MLDLAQLPPEIFSPASYAEKPKSFQPFADAVLQSDGLHVVTPEYNGGMPGIWGALRPVEQLQAIFAYRNAHLYPERVFPPQINNLLDASGRLKDAELLGRLKTQASGFTDFVERLKNVKLRGARL